MNAGVIFLICIYEIVSHGSAKHRCLQDEILFMPRNKKENNNV